MTTESTEMYYDLKSLDCFLNANNNTDKVAKMLQDITEQRKLAQTPEVKYMWMKLEAKVTLLAQEIVDVLESANKQAIKIGYKIIK